MDKKQKAMFGTILLILIIISLLIGTVIYFSGKIISNLIVKKHEKTNK